MSVIMQMDSGHEPAHKNPIIIDCPEGGIEEKIRICWIGSAPSGIYLTLNQARQLNRVLEFVIGEHDLYD